MKLSNPIGRESLVGPHGLLDESPKTKKWQMQAKPTWHHFGGKINWLRPKKK
jgi:hypothetical protein